MNAQTTLTANERQTLTHQTGQLLVLIGNLLAHESVLRAYGSDHASKDLVKLGRKLIDAGKSRRNR